MPSFSTIFPTNNGFCFESSQNTILPLVEPCFHKAPYQALISLSCPHHLILVFSDLILGYVIPLDLYLDFLMARLYPKHLFISTLHSLDCDLNLRTLGSKCILK